MTMVINGSGTITGLSAGGLPDATVQTADIVDANITQAKLAANVAGNGPAFSAYNSANQGVSNNTSTKAVFNSTYFNQGTGWDTSNNWFKPTIAGYYQINFQIGNNSASYYKFATLNKNGSVWFTGTRIDAAQSYISTGSTVVYLNGSTDYLELYGYVSSGASFNSPVSNDTCTLFSGFLARAA